MQIFTYGLILLAGLIICWLIAKKLDKLITAAVKKIPIMLVGDKTSFWIFRPILITFPFVVLFIIFIWHSLRPGQGVGFIFGWFIFYISLVVGLNGTREYIGTVIEISEHKNWAEKNGFQYKDGMGWMKRYLEQDFILTLGNQALGWLNNYSGGVDPAKCIMIIRTINPINRSFTLPLENFELWTKIGPEHLEFIKNHNITIVATKKWFLLKIVFAEFDRIAPEKIFEIMHDSLREIKYRVGAGFDYKTY